MIKKPCKAKEETVLREATKEILEWLDALAEKRKQEILHTKDALRIDGSTYYVSNAGDDENDGKSPEAAWKTLKKVAEFPLSPGDGVLFRRGDLFRGTLHTQEGVSYGAYGEGEKPRFYAWDKNLSDPSLWTLFDADNHIWRLNEKILDCGTLVFNGGEKHAYKHIPSYRHGKFYCRWKEGVEFDMAAEMQNDLDIYWHYEERFSTEPSNGEDFPIPIVNAASFGDLYLRCDRGNPATVFADIEAIPKRSVVYVAENNHVTVDNLCIKYANFAVSGGGINNVGLHVTNCEIGWIGGCIMSYAGNDPNYTEEKRGGVTRFGNGIEIYGGCTDFLVDNNYIYQVYDAGASHQITTLGNTYRMTNIRYSRNLIERCAYAIEYFLEERDRHTGSGMDGVEMHDNFLRLGGYGWGQQRHNTYTPALIKGWNYENTAENYAIHDNIFDRCAYRLVHLVAEKAEYCPKMYRNTYVQKFGMTLGQYGAKENGAPEVIAFYEDAEDKLRTVMGETDATVYYLR